MTVSYPHPGLLWCHCGTATITVGDRSYELIEGDLLYTAAASDVADRGLVLPIFFPTNVIKGPSRKLHLGLEWGDVMVSEFARSLGCTTGKSGLSGDVARLFSEPAAPPPMPIAPEARAVAATLRNNPAEQTALEDFALSHNVSSRTLQRQFLSSTGLTFSQWRTAYRVASAAELLAMDFSVAVVANLVGFAATSSLTRAFRRHTGCTPSAYTPCTVGQHPAGTPPTIPASTIWHRTRGDDMTFWVYRGTATLTTTGYCRFLGTGDTATIPADTSTRLDIAAGSIALPLAIDGDLDSTPTLKEVVATYRQAIGAITADKENGPDVCGFTKRMERGRKLLAEGLKPQEVSRQVGFRTTAAFSRAFKALNGLAPRDYQNHTVAEPTTVGS